jgi:hypothetical protein
MRPRRLAFSVFIALLLAAATASPSPREQNWTNYVRIGAYGLRTNNADKIVVDAQASGVFGIEVDNDVEGRYESFVDPAAKLQAIHAVAEKAHAAGNYAFVYIAGTECITANAAKTQHTLAKDHPDWLQRKITGEPAVFGGGSAFWIQQGDEDVWVSPFAPAWRKIYMQHVRQIAATGIDGIYVDIPYWMTHFEGWEDTWASFDDYTVAVFCLLPFFSDESAKRSVRAAGMVFGTALSFCPPLLLLEVGVNLEKYGRGGYVAELARFLPLCFITALCMLGVSWRCGRGDRNEFIRWAKRGVLGFLFASLLFLLTSVWGSVWGMPLKST